MERSKTLNFLEIIVLRKCHIESASHFVMQFFRVCISGNTDQKVPHLLDEIDIILYS